MTEFASRTKLVVGLGNPGVRYVGTRHNVGFEVLNLLSRKFNAPTPRSKFDGQFTSVSLHGATLLLAWPLTYMNNSGRCVKAMVDFYKMDVVHDLMVVCDDLSLPLGKLRLRAKGSAGGQKGLQDILRVLGSQEIPRLRVGIDPPPPQWDAADYVLGKFRKDELAIVDEALLAAVNCVADWCQNDIAHCMNRVN